MKREQFIQYIENPLLLGDANISELKSVVETYPFFQTAHLLYAKALSNVNHIDYYTGLKKTSILAGDRKILYELITKSSPQKNTSAFSEKTSEEKETIKHEKEETEKKNLVAEKIILPEIKLVSNISEKTKQKEQTINFETKPLVETSKEESRHEEVEQQHKEKTTRIELVVTNRDEKKPEEKKEEQQVIKQEEKKTPEIFIEPKEKNVDDVVLGQVVNAYIETEFFDVKNIDKPIKQQQPVEIDPEEGKKILTESLNEPHSFSQWLKLLSTEKKKEEKHISTEKEISEEKKISNTEIPAKKIVKEQEKIINKIISTEPSISKLKKTTEFFKPVEKAKESIIKDETLVTETLAWILEKQGKFPEAIRAYETLSLKYPEKSVKFASLISEIRIKQKQR
ncbi:MAG: hypothetical protein IAF38_08850 [Bacteroidia bacterium]|nr:hypothetical protein [Bacteroidia bacterium]